MPERDQPSPDAFGSDTPGGDRGEQIASLKRRLEAVNRALESARPIGAAVGIIMATRKLTYDDAFAVIVQASKNQNRKVRDLADELIRYGTLLSDAG